MSKIDLSTYRLNDVFKPYIRRDRLSPWVSELRQLLAPSLDKKEDLFTYNITNQLNCFYAKTVACSKKARKAKKLNLWNINNILQLSLTKQTIKNTKNQIKDFGTILSLNQGIVRVNGLIDVFIGEIIVIGGQYFGMVTTVAKDHTQALLFTHDDNINNRMLVKRCRQLVSIPIGLHLLGNVVDCLGNILTSPHTSKNFQKNKPKSLIFRTLEIKAPGIIDRSSISDALTTGILSVDAVVPIGRGQRELILGDRNVGKTSLATTAILNQKSLHLSKVPMAMKPVYCVYVAVGQKISAVSRVASLLKRENCFFFSIIVAATASEPASLQFLAPYTGCAIGEWFRDRLGHALVVYDDLSSQATAYRQIALLLRRPPGREAYPGDIFYLHSRLLERAGKLGNKRGVSSSLTVLPIVETFDGEISAFIPTNVISITDGQLYLDPTLFHNGFTPAVSFKLSVSRVGSNAQLKTVKKLAFNLKNIILNYQELASFSAIEASAVPLYIRTILIKGAQVALTLQQEQSFQSILQTQYFIANAALMGAFNRIKKSNYRVFKEFLFKHFHIDIRWNMTGSITAAFMDNAAAERLVRYIIIPTFLFDKVNMFLAESPSHQKPLFLPKTLAELRI